MIYIIIYIIYDISILSLSSHFSSFSIPRSMMSIFRDLKAQPPATRRENWSTDTSSLVGVSGHPRFCDSNILNHAKLGTGARHITTKMNPSPPQSSWCEGASRNLSRSAQNSFAHSLLFRIGHTTARHPPGQLICFRNLHP